MLTFREAIEEVEGGSVSRAELEKHLREMAPEIADLVLKDMTAGDVHVSTALGNQKGKKRRKIPAVVPSDAKDDEGDDDTEKSFSGGTVTKKITWRRKIEIFKTDAEEMKVYGWASVSMENGKAIVDKQDDIIAPDDLRKAAEEFALYYASQGDMHERKGVGRLCQSLVTTADVCEAAGIVVKNNRVGWFVCFKVDDPDVWKRIKSGELPEFSIGGRAERVEV